MKRVLSYGKGVLTVTVECKYPNIGEAFAQTLEDIASQQRVELVLPMMIAVEEGMSKKKETKKKKK